MFNQFFFNENYEFEKYKKKNIIFVCAPLIHWILYSKASLSNAASSFLASHAGLTGLGDWNNSPLSTKTKANKESYDYNFNYKLNSSKTRQSRPWNATCDIWQIRGWNFSHNFSSPALMVWDRQCWEGSERNDHLINQSMY